MKVQRPCALPSTFLVDRRNVVGWLVVNYVQTPLTNYYLELSEHATYMKTHHEVTPYEPAQYMWSFLGMINRDQQVKGLFCQLL
jgi:hypothetical protein